MLARASSCVGNSWCHAMFKIKYCHRIFDIDEVRGYIAELIILISSLYNMPIKKMGFGDNHVYFRVDIKLRSKPEAAKIFREITAKKLFEKFPENDILPRPKGLLISFATFCFAKSGVS